MRLSAISGLANRLLSPRINQPYTFMGRQPIQLVHRPRVSSPSFHSPLSLPETCHSCLPPCAHDHRYHCRFRKHGSRCRPTAPSSTIILPWGAPPLVTESSDNSIDSATLGVTPPWAGIVTSSFPPNRSVLRAFGLSLAPTSRARNSPVS